MMRSIHSREFRLAGLVLLTNAIPLAWILWGPKGTTNFYPVLDSIMSLILLSGAYLGLRAFLTLRKEVSSLQWTPLLLAIGIFLTFGGQTINLYYDIYQPVAGPPYPSLADVFYLSAYPFYVWGIMLFPVSRLSSTARMRRATDGVLMVLVLITLSWYFVLGPTIAQASGPLPAMLTGIAYPCADLLLLCCAVVLYTKGSHIRRDLLLPLIFLALGLLFLTLTDSIDGFIQLNNLQTSPFEFLGWFTGYLLICLSLHLVRLRGSMEGEAITERTSWKQSLLPYALTAAIIPLIVVIWKTGSTGLVTSGAGLGCLLVIVLLLLRQVLAIKTVHEANTRLEALSTTDPLTELPNHRALATMLEQELERARRFEHTCCLLFLDIDHFKALNDGYGHAAGDIVLKDCAALVRRTIHAHDTVGRWGGEEFVVILPELSQEEGRLMAEQVREAVASHRFAIGGGSHVTCSVGVACFPIHAQTRDGLTHAADQAMYGAKRLGRNQVRVSGDPAIEALLAAEHHQNRDEAALEGTVEALVSMAGVRYPAERTHAQNVAVLLQKLADALGLDSAEAHMLTLAGQLHDIGKVSIPDAILASSEKLSPEAWTYIQAHPKIGAEIVSNIPALRPLAPIIRAHHERWDGTGYPDGLVAANIPRGARILAVVNAYHAMLETRIYRKYPLSRAEAIAELQKGAGTQFDPEIVVALLHLLEQEPLTASDQTLITV